MADEAVLRNLGRRVRHLRNQRRQSQEQLAERADLSVAYISGIERGVRNVSTKNLVKLAKALECSVGSFFDEDPS